MYRNKIILISIIFIIKKKYIMKKINSEFFYGVSMFILLCTIVSITLSSISLSKVSPIIIVNTTDINATNVHAVNLFSENIYAVNINESNTDVTNLNLTYLNLESLHATNLYTTNLYVPIIDTPELIIKDGDVQTTITYNGLIDSNYVLPDVPDGASFVMTKGNQSISDVKVFSQETEFNNGIIFGTQNVLNKNVISVFTFYWNLGINATGTFSRIGDVITLTLERLTNSSIILVAKLSHSNPLPIIYRPIVDLAIVIPVLNGGSTLLGMLEYVSPYTHILISRNTGANFGSPGIPGTTISYVAGN